MTTDKQNKEFCDYMANKYKYNQLLDESIEWIRNNLDPEYVFSAKQLERWAEANDLTKK